MVPLSTEIGGGQTNRALLKKYKHTNNYNTYKQTSKQYLWQDLVKFYQYYLYRDNF